MAMAKLLPTKAPGKGDLVVGHRVWIFSAGNLPAVPGVVVAATDATVTIEVDRMLAMMGLPRRTEWTWRRSVGAYQQKGVRTKRGACVAIDARPRTRS